MSAALQDPPSRPPEAWPHVRVDAQGVAWIDQTHVKVVEVVLARKAWGWSPELIHENYPHLSLSQIYAALAWYFDHQEDTDRRIAEGLELADDVQARQRPKPSREELLRRLKGR